MKACEELFLETVENRLLARESHSECCELLLIDGDDEVRSLLIRSIEFFLHLGDLGIDEYDFHLKLLDSLG